MNFMIVKKISNRGDKRFLIKGDKKFYQNLEFLTLLLHNMIKVSVSHIQIATEGLKNSAVPV